jgi:hypothetical protein
MAARLAAPASLIELRLVIINFSRLAWSITKRFWRRGNRGLSAAHNADVLLPRAAPPNVPVQTDLAVDKVL